MRTGGLVGFRDFFQTLRQSTLSALHLFSMPSATDDTQTLTIKALKWSPTPK